MGGTEKEKKPYYYDIVINKNKNDKGVWEYRKFPNIIEQVALFHLLYSFTYLFIYLCIYLFHFVSLFIDLFISFFIN